MGITMIKPRLVMHYAPGVLAVLRRETCSGFQNWNGIGHGTCCDKDHQIFKIVNIEIVPDDEKQGLLELSWINDAKRYKDWLVSR